MDGFNNGMGNFNSGMNNMNWNYGANGPDYTLFMILGVIQIVLICCCNIPTVICGIITVAYTVQANNLYKAGQIQLYGLRMKTAKIANIVGWVLLLAGTVLSVVSGALSNIANALSNY